MANVRSEARLEVLANLIGAVDEAIISEVDVMTKWARG